MDNINSELSHSLYDRYVAIDKVIRQRLDKGLYRGMSFSLWAVLYRPLVENLESIMYETLGEKDG